MEVRSRSQAEPFTALDESTIRVIADARVGGAFKQSLAEATVAAGKSTRRHYHAATEEIYVVLEGNGELEVEEKRAVVSPGDAVLIPPRARHRIRAGEEGELRFLCCCAPAYRDEDTFFDEQ